jgi:hypothetical protein
VGFVAIAVEAGETVTRAVDRVARIGTGRPHGASGRYARAWRARFHFGFRGSRGTHPPR